MQLTECEAIIERGLASFLEMGQALLRIRDGRMEDVSVPHQPDAFQESITR